MSRLPVTKQVLSCDSHLFLHILVLWVQQFNENGNSSCFNHNLGVQEGPRGDVGQCPGRFELLRAHRGQYDNNNSFTQYNWRFNAHNSCVTPTNHFNILAIIIKYI